VHFELFLILINHHYDNYWSNYQNSEWYEGIRELLEDEELTNQEAGLALCISPSTNTLSHLKVVKGSITLNHLTTIKSFRMETTLLPEELGSWSLLGCKCI